MGTFNKIYIASIFIWDKNNVPINKRNVQMIPNGTKQTPPSKLT